MFIFCFCFLANRLHFAADDAAALFHPNGENVTTLGWHSSTAVELTSTCVIAIEALNNSPGPMGLIASTDDGVVTDDTWRCTSQEEADWFSETFDDSHWPSAHMWYDNGDGYWNQISSINSDAKWIWTENQNELSIFCRKQLCPGKDDF